MRYQKWNKYGDCKIVCYSTQKSTRESKPYLVKSDSCSQERFWASDVEDAVAEALFEMSYLANTEDTKAPVYIDPFEAIEKELKAVKSKLSKLLDLEDDFDDDILREKIQTLSSRKRELERQLSDEQTRQSLQKRGTPSSRRRLRRIGDRENRWMGERNSVIANTPPEED